MDSPRFLALLSIATLATASASEPATPWESWKMLRMNARAGFFLSGRVEMRIGREEGKTRFETATGAKFMGVRVARSRTLTVIDSVSGKTEEYLSFSPKRGRHYVFGESGYSVSKLAPKNGYHAPLDEWLVTSEQEYAYPTGPGGEGHVRVYDYYGMLLHLRDVPLEQLREGIQLHVATSRGPQAYTISVGEQRSARRSYTDLTTGEKRTVPAEEFRLTITPADQEAGEGFLGIKGKTEIWVEARTRTLLQISGDVPKVPGRVVVELTGLAH